MTIERLSHNEPIPYDLLLSADPDKHMIETYIHDSIVYVTRDTSGRIIGIIAYLPLSTETVEIKNIAVHQHYQNQGIGTRLIKETLQYIKHRSYSKVIIGTGNTSVKQLRLYQKLGFRIKEKIEGFFTENYPFPIEENGSICKDKIVLEMDI
jgi:ribosomal protein S18 acetylase RimI-like enzyme